MGDASFLSSSHGFLKEFDTGRWSVLHIIFPSSPTSNPGFWRLRLLPYLSTAVVAYGTTFLLALFSRLPMLIESSSKTQNLVFLRDMHTAWLMLVTLPLLVVFVVTEREEIPSGLFQVAREGALDVDIDATRRLCQTWEGRYGYVNLFAQLAGVILGCAVAVSNCMRFSERECTSWQVTNGSINPAGWAYVFWLFLFYFVLTVLLVRCAGTCWFFHDLTRASRIAPVPKHPDNCGGLHPVSKIAVRVWLLFLVAGVNIVLMALDFRRFPDDTTGMVRHVILAVVAYVVVCPACFIGPLLPFHKAMAKAKEDIVALTARRMRAVFQKTHEKVATDQALTTEDVEQLKRLQEMSQLAQRLPVWPFNAKLLMKVVTPYAMSVAALAAAPVAAAVVGVAKSGVEGAQEGGVKGAVKGVIEGAGGAAEGIMK
ncbi:MAG: hypothetical protein ACYS9X_12840 [Planctomycetota bacterium]|jgi:hypothetical protein